MPHKEDITPEITPAPVERTAPTPVPVAAAPAAPAAPAVDVEAIRKEERERVSGIQTAVRTAGIGEEFAAELVKNETPIGEARGLIFAEMAKRQEKESNLPRVSAIATESRDIGVESYRAGAENALSHRSSGGEVALTEEGNQFRGLRVIDIMREGLMCKNVAVRGKTPHDIVNMTMRAGSTSDFPHLVADVSNKSLVRVYQEREQNFKPLTRPVMITDFKNINRKALGDAPVLRKIVEGGEVTLGSISDSGVSYALSSYGRKMSYTREMMINDDLDALSRIPEAFGRRSRELEGDIFWAQITGAPVMSDGNVLWDAAHNNTGAGVAGVVASVSAGELAMGLQEGLDGGKINIDAKYILCPKAQRTVWRQFLAQNTAPQTASDVNPYADEFALISDARLDAVSAVQFYMAADKGQVDLVEMGFLEGATGPTMDSQTNFDTRAVDMAIWHDVVARVIDWRGLYRSSGV